MKIFNILHDEENIIIYTKIYYIKKMFIIRIKLKFYYRRFKIFIITIMMKILLFLIFNFESFFVDRPVEQTRFYH